MQSQIIEHQLRRHKRTPHNSTPRLALDVGQETGRVEHVVGATEAQEAVAERDFSFKTLEDMRLLEARQVSIAISQLLGESCRLDLEYQLIEVQQLQIFELVRDVHHPAVHQVLRRHQLALGAFLAPLLPDWDVQLRELRLPVLVDDRLVETRAKEARLLARLQVQFCQQQLLGREVLHECLALLTVIICLLHLGVQVILGNLLSFPKRGLT